MKKAMGETKAVTAKVPAVVYDELVLRVPEGGRSDFIRDAIVEKLERAPKPDRVLELEKRMDRLESDVSEVKKYLADLELLTYGKEKMNPHAFCMDETDHKITDFLIHYKGATTPELAEYLKMNRFTILHRLRRIQRNSKKQLGKPIIDYYAGERSGKKKAWWINLDMVET